MPFPPVDYEKEEFDVNISNTPMTRQGKQNLLEKQTSLQDEEEEFLSSLEEPLFPDAGEELHPINEEEWRAASEDAFWTGDTPLIIEDAPPSAPEIVIEIDEEPKGADILIELDKEPKGADIVIELDEEERGADIVIELEEEEEEVQFPNILERRQAYHNLSEASGWRIGDIIAEKYHVKEIIGRGGMGIVYRVSHQEWDIDLAVKMPLLEMLTNELVKARFMIEAQTWIDLGLHPNIVQCWYVRELDGIPCVFMDYLAGGSLKDWMKQGRVKSAELDIILDVMIQACDGLGYAHQHGVEAHRDVKPANLLLSEEGEVHVTDFGIVKYKGSEEIEETGISGAPLVRHHQTLTMTGTDLGTPEYSAPEQWGHARHADARSDIYALGGILFELCCGRRVFDDGTHRAPAPVLIGRHLFAPILDPRTLNPHLPDCLVNLMIRCLAKEPAERPQSMAEVRRQLAEI